MHDGIRFWRHVEVTDACWLWRGGVKTDGYGVCWRDGRSRIAHREAYRLMRGPIPEGLVLDHLCRVRHCVNPDHLDVVTQRTNIMRGVGITARFAQMTTCIHGHPFDGVKRKNGVIGRYCKTCGHDDYMKSRARRLRRTWERMHGRPAPADMVFPLRPRFVA